jgi:hypothetical protein
MPTDVLDNSVSGTQRLLDYLGRKIEFHPEWIYQALNTIEDPSRKLIIRNQSGRHINWAVLDSILRQWSINLDEPFVVFIDIMPHGDSGEVSAYWLDENGKWKKRKISSFSIQSISRSWIAAKAASSILS